MSTRNTLLRDVVASILVMAGAGSALAADAPPTDHPVPSKEVREKMATVHEQMATCLRSDKPIADCRKEMMKNCRDLMGHKGCPMMGMGMHHMMKDHSSDTPEHK